MLNNPINASDPSGHKCVGEPEECLSEKGTPINGTGGLSSGSQGDSGGDGPSPTNATQTKDKTKDEDNWPNNPPWDQAPAPIQSHAPLDILFDPWAGYSYSVAINDPDRYYDGVHDWKVLSGNAYTTAGLDLRQIVNSKGNNPLTEEQAISMVPGLLVRARWAPYNAFLKELGLGTGPQHITNYEPRFLEGLMIANPRALNTAKEIWRIEEDMDSTLADIRQTLRTRGGFGTIP